MQPVHNPAVPAAPAATAAAAAAAGEAVAPGAAQPEVHQLGNAGLPPDVAASLLQQAAAAAAPGELAGVSPPALFLGSNQDNKRLAFGDLCQLFGSGVHYSPAAGQQGVVFAFRDEAGVPLAERLPAADRGRWKGSFGGRPTTSFQQSHGFIKNTTTFKRKDGTIKLTMHLYELEMGSARLLHLFNVEQAQQGQQAPQPPAQQQTRAQAQGAAQALPLLQPQPPQQLDPLQALSPLLPKAGVPAQAPLQAAAEMQAVYDRFCASPSPDVPELPNDTELDALLGVAPAAEKRSLEGSPGSSSGARRPRQEYEETVLPIPGPLHDKIAVVVGTNFRHFSDIEAGTSAYLRLEPPGASTHVRIRGSGQAVQHASRLLERHFAALIEQNARSVSVPQRSLHVLCGPLQAGGRFVPLPSGTSGPHVDLRNGWRPLYVLVPVPQHAATSFAAGVNALSAALSGMVVQSGSTFLLAEGAALESLAEDLGSECLPGQAVKLHCNLGTQRFGDSGRSGKYKAVTLPDLGTLSLARLRALHVPQNMRTYFDNGVPADVLPALRARLAQLGFAPPAPGGGKCPTKSHAVLHFMGNPAARCDLPRASITFDVSTPPGADPVLAPCKVKILGRKVSFLTFLHGDSHPDVRFKTLSMLADGRRQAAAEGSMAAAAWEVADGCRVAPGSGPLSKRIRLADRHQAHYIVDTVRLKRKETYQRTVQLENGRRATQRVSIKRAEQDGGERWEVSLRCQELAAAGAAGSVAECLAHMEALLALGRQLRSALDFGAAA